MQSVESFPMHNPAMVFTLEKLAASVRDVLTHESTPTNRESAARLLAAALADGDFVAEQFSPGVGPRKVLYEDPVLGFCIVAHEYPGPKVGAPHDHGPSWAIYGQAAGETLMRDYERSDAPSWRSTVRETRSYLMRTGDVHVYNEGDVHAPSRTATTRLLRIEGMNLAGVARSAFDVVEDSPCDETPSRRIPNHIPR